MSEESKAILQKLEELDIKVRDIQLTLENELRRLKERIEQIA